MKALENVYANRKGTFTCLVTEGDEIDDHFNSFAQCVERCDDYIVYLDHNPYLSEHSQLLIKLRPGLPYAVNNNLGPVITPEVDNLFRRIRVLIASKDIEVNVETLLKSIKEYMLKPNPEATTIQAAKLDRNVLHLKITEATKLIVEDPNGLLTIEFKKKG